MGEACLCDMSDGFGGSGSYREKPAVTQSLRAYDNYEYLPTSQYNDHTGICHDRVDEHNTKNTNLNSDDCCGTVQCSDQCMCNPPLISSQKNRFIKSNTTSYPQQGFAHFYHIYIILSSPPPVV